MELNGSYIHPHWRLMLAGLGLNTMKDWLALDKTLVDEPNQRGRGISQVFRASVIGAEGEPVTVYIKHQRNYVRRSVLHPVSGQTTLYQEYRALMRCRPHYRRWQPRFRDLETLARRASALSARDRLRFLSAYLARPLADSEGRSLMARMERKFKLRGA